MYSVILLESIYVWMNGGMLLYPSKLRLYTRFALNPYSNHQQTLCPFHQPYECTHVIRFLTNVSEAIRVGIHVCVGLILHHGIALELAVLS